MRAALRKTLFTGLAVGVALTAAPSSAESGSPTVFNVEAAAAPVANGSAAPGIVPLFVETGMARSSTTFNSQPNVISQAAIGWFPLAEAAPALLGTPPPPAAPYCYSYFPGDPRDASCGGPTQASPTFNAEGGSARTTTEGEASDPRSLRTRAAVRASGVSGVGALQPVSFGSVASAISAGAEADRLAAGASTSADDLAIGPLLIRSVRSSVSGALGGVPGSASLVVEFEVSGASVGGVPVTIDEEGVRANDQGAGGLGPAQEQVNTALSQAGISVRTVPPEEPTSSPDGTALRAESPALRVDVASSEGFQTFFIGRSSLDMVASRGADGTAGDSTTFSAGGSDTEALDSGASGSPGGEAAAPPPAPEPGTGAGPASSVPFTKEVTAAALASWRIPYSPFALLILALPLLVQARRIAPRRLP